MDIRLTVSLGVCSILMILATHAACQGGGSGDCLFRFHLQPNANLSCNPYNNQDTSTTINTATILHITCLAIGPLESALQVDWWSSSEINNSNLTIERVDTDSSSDYFRVIETETIQQAERLISSTLSITIATGSEERERGSLCLWCEIQAPGNTLVEPTSNHLCIKEPETYSKLRPCDSQEVVDHNFNPVCVKNLVQNSNSLDTPSILEIMPTSHLRTLGSDSVTFTTQLENHNMHTPTDTPGSVYIDSSIDAQLTQYLATTGTPHLSPSPTKEAGSNHSTAMLSNASLIALYTTGVICILLAIIVLVLIIVVMVMCRRHTKLQNKETNHNSRKMCSSLQKPGKLGQNTPLRAHYNIPQPLYSGCDTLAGESKDRGDTSYIKSDIRCGSEQDIGRGSYCGSREPSLSTEKSNSLSRKNSMHKYTEIDTISHTDISIHSKTSHSLHAASHGDGIHQLSTNTTTHTGNGFITGVAADSSKVIPPPPNMRSRSSSTPHFYYILEKLDDEEDREMKNVGNKLKSPWELTAQREEQSSKKSNSREGSMENQSGSLKRDTDTTAVEFGWGDGSIRSRSGSCPSRERKGGSLKKIVISREGSSKSSTKSSRNGSGKKTSSSAVNEMIMETTAMCSDGSREGSVKSRGSHDGSFKKEVWVPTRDQQTFNELLKKQVQQDKRPHKDYDILEPRYGSHPPLYSIINESYFDLGQDNTGMLFDDPKYAAVSVGDLPQLMNEREHQLLDPIIPPPQRMIHKHNYQPQHKELNKSPQSSAPSISKMKAVSSKSLQDSSGAVSCIGNRARGSSIYQTRDSTPNRDSVMGVNGNTPSRLSMPAFDAY